MPEFLSRFVVRPQSAAASLMLGCGLLGCSLLGCSLAGKQAAPVTGASATPAAAPATVAQPLTELAPAKSGIDVPVPSACTPAVNQKIAQMVLAHPRGYTENVMVCGIATGTTVNSGGEHGSHHLITVSASLPGVGSKFVQIAINDTLDGVVTARAGQSVFAFGEGYTVGGKWVAGVHDVHCSTHSTADNGWVVVDGVKTPTSCPSR